MMAIMTKIFKNGNSHAVRIPAELAYDHSDLEVEIERIGEHIIIKPARRPLDKVMEKFVQFSSDFMAQGRDENEVAERAVL
jgi:antitoxin VapB